jgi:hypothetical protein
MLTFFFLSPIASAKRNGPGLFPSDFVKELYEPEAALRSERTVLNCRTQAKPSTVASREVSD